MIRFEPQVRQSTRLYQFAWAIAFLTLLGFSLWVTPDPNGHGTHTQLGLPPCPSTLVFNRPCPGCGMTTSFAYCSRMDFVGGFQAHPFGPALFLGWALTAGMALWGSFKGLRLDTDSRAFQWTLALYAIAFFVYGGIRFAQGFPPGPSSESLAIRAGLR